MSQKNSEIRSQSSSTFQTVDPARGEILATYHHAEDSEVERALALIAEAKASPVKERKKRLIELAQVLRAQKSELGLLVSREMGKTVVDALSEIEKSATACEYFANTIEDFQQEQRLSSGTQQYRVWSQGMGSLLAIMPWNFPIWQLMRALPAAYALGNPVVLKHSDLMAGSAAYLTKLVQDVLGPAFFQNLRINHTQTARVIRDPRIRSVTMTGSSRGGREVAAEAGRALKKVVLELGGSDPYLVFEDADLRKAAEVCARTRLINLGQSCISGKRFLIAAQVWNQFLPLFLEEMRKPQIGDPQGLDTQLGPLAHQRFKAGLIEQTEELARQGGRKIWEKELVLSSELSKGAFFAPQVWEVTGSEAIVREDEFFGPVALMMRFESEEEAISLANNSVFGLGAGVLSQDQKRLHRVAQRLDVGFVALNDFVRSDPQVPFGGVKDSGFGRELGIQGLREWVNFKTVSGTFT